MKKIIVLLVIFAFAGNVSFALNESITSMESIQHDPNQGRTGIHTSGRHIHPNQIIITAIIHGHIVLSF